MRWWTLRAAGALHGLYAAILLAISTYCFVLAHAAARGSGNPKHAAGLYAGGWATALLGITYLVGTFGLWKSRNWAWWLCVVANIVPAILIICDIAIGDDDPDNFSAIVFFAIPTALLLLARVRRKAAVKHQQGES
jgi:uncharacterized membrane protein (DUF2068 family)